MVYSVIAWGLYVGGLVVFVAASARSRRKMRRRFALDAAADEGLRRRLELRAWNRQ